MGDIGTTGGQSVLPGLAFQSEIPDKKTIMASLGYSPSDGVDLSPAGNFFVTPLNLDPSAESTIFGSAQSTVFKTGTTGFSVQPQTLSLGDKSAYIDSLSGGSSAIPSASTWNQNTVLLSTFNFDSTTAASAHTIDSSDTAVIQNVITANNNQPVAVTPSTQNYDLNGNLKVDSGDVNLMNSIVTFAKVSVNQQASTLSALTPQLGAVVVNSVLAQGTTDQTKLQSYSAVAAIFEHMQAKDAAEVVDAVVPTANGAQNAGKIFDRMNTVRAAAVADQIADPESVNDAQTAAAVIENMALERAIALIDSRGLQTDNCGLILTKMTSTKLEWASQLMQAMNEDRAVAVVKQMERLPVARILGTMQAQDAAEIIADPEMPVATAAGILDLTGVPQAYQILKQCQSNPVLGGSGRTASIMAAMAPAQAGGVLVQFYDAYKQQAGSSQRITGIPAYMNLMMQPELSAQKLGKMLSAIDPAKAADLIESAYALRRTFSLLGSKVSAAYKNLSATAQPKVAAELGDKLAAGVQNFKPSTTRLWTNGFGEVNIYLYAFDDWTTPDVNEMTRLTPENIKALNIASVGAGVTVTYADGTTGYVWMPVEAEQIDNFGNVDLLIEPDILRNATGVEVQLYYWKVGDPVDQAHALTLGDTVSSGVRLSPFIMQLPALSVASGRPGQNVEFQFQGKVDIGDLIGGGVWIDYSDPNTKDEFWMLDDFEYMIDPVTGTFSMNVPAGVKSMKFYGQQQHGTTKHFTYSTTVTF